MKNWQKLIISILICQLAGGIGSVFTFSAIPNWYDFLNKPQFNPPNWIFGPVWTILYTLMGISAYLIFNKDKKALMIFAVQLVLNAFWSIIFFGFHSILGGLIFIILLWFSILLTIAKFYKIDKNAAFLLIPYVLWVSFATILNYYLLVLN